MSIIEILIKTKCIKLICSTCVFAFLSTTSWAQTASIKEEVRALKTYPFSDPNPVPILTSNPKIYPYFRFDGYSHDASDKEWKVVVMENEYIRVFVLPEAGGKVWGAIEKSTGEEFIYRNEVMKFRNISMRGPWTSGGIEFNFGIIGHTPSTATPVDYLTRTNDDGSVTCVVGNMDIPSGTHWRVIINLPNDKAYFETKVVWYNATPTHQSYYNWMTGAAASGDDLEFYIPGNQYITHPGEAKPWPYDGDRKISDYRQNNYGPSKSYHVVGEYNDFFGGYFHDSKFGFGHWSLYDEMPGQKLWLWALSRSGGIWENLLTDADGQYIEFQAGRQFNQYSPADHINPITKVPFAPYLTDTWTELWFPVKEIGGMAEVSPSGVLNVTQEGNKVTIGINALETTKGTLTATIDGKNLLKEEISLKPMEVLIKNVNTNKSGILEVEVNEMDLHYSSDPEKNILKRPFTSVETADNNSAEALYRQGMELYEDRDFKKAKGKFKESLNVDPFHQPTLLAMAELFYISGKNEDALKSINQVLQQDTYHPRANFQAGTVYKALNDDLNAIESLGWSARSIEFRSASYAQMAEILLGQKEYNKASDYAGKALDFNRYNVNAHLVKAITARKTNDTDRQESTISNLLGVDPLNHFARFEQYLNTKDQKTKADFINSIQNELPDQTYLELAIYYVNQKMYAEASELFTMINTNPIANLWLSYLSQTQVDKSSKYLDKAIQLSPAFVFPFRKECIPILEWAVNKNDNWKLKYYLALNYWSKNRFAEATSVMEACQQAPDYFAFYLSRADLLQKISGKDALPDITKSVQLAPDEWRTHDQLIGYYNDNGDYQQALNASSKAFKSFPSSNSIGFKHVNALLQNNKPQEAVNTLSKLKILPFEGASEGRELYENAHLMLAVNFIESKKYDKAVDILEKARLWPETLGAGKPYDPDERAINYLIGYAHLKKGDEPEAEKYFQLVLSKPNSQPNHPSLLAQLLAARALGDQEILEAMLIAAKNFSGDFIEWAISKFNGEEATVKKGKENLKIKIFDILLSDNSTSNR